MCRRILCPSLTLAVLAMSTLSWADEPAPAKEQFFVYGGSCSRSIRVQGTYDKVEDAFAAADKLRKAEMKHVTVRTGAHQRDWFGTAASEYRLYGQSCRSRIWFVRATADSPAKAQEMVEKLKQDGFSPVEIVGYYAAK